MSRRTVGLLAAILLVLPATASAAARTESVSLDISTFCERATGATGSAEMGLSLSGEVEDGLFGNFGVFYWEPGLDPETDLPRIMFGFDESPVLTQSPDVTSLSLEGPLEDSDTGESLGTASLSATLVPSGTPTVTTFGSSGTNQQFSVVQTIQPLVAEADLILPSGLGTFTFPNCSGESFEMVTSSTNPDALIEHDFGNPSNNISCRWVDENGDQTQLFAGSGAEFAVVFFHQSLPTGGSISGFFDSGFFEEGGLILTTEIFQATLPLEITDENGQPIGTVTATIDGTLVLGEKQHVTTLVATQMDRLFFAPLTVEGTLTLSTGQSFDLSTCEGERLLSLRQFHFDPVGPKPGGRIPVNDTLEGAIALDPGRRLTTNTKGAALEPEVAVSGACADGVGIRSTLWYSFQGTGGEVTLDTAGSGFDTVVAVYVEGAEGLSEVACVDDVGLSTQAAVTLPTETGVTYYVQVGGFLSFSQPNEFGVLRLAVTA